MKWKLALGALGSLALVAAALLAPTPARAAPDPFPKGTVRDTGYAANADVFSSSLVVTRTGLPGKPNTSVFRISVGIEAGEAASSFYVTETIGAKTMRLRLGSAALVAGDANTFIWHGVHGTAYNFQFGTTTRAARVTVDESVNDGL